MMVGVRTAAWAKSGAPLPYDSEVEYLDSQNDNLPFIDLGVRATSHDVWKLEIGINIKNTSSAFFGAANDSSRYATAWCTKGGSIRYGGRYEYSSTSFWKLNNTVNEIELTSENVIINSTPISGVGHPFDDSKSSMNVYLFACNGFSSIGCRVFHVQRLVDGVLYFDLIPVRFTNENGVSEGAMYDRVSGQLFRNAGTGAFVIGPDKT